MVVLPEPRKPVIIVIGIGGIVVGFSFFGCGFWECWVLEGFVVVAGSLSEVMIDGVGILFRKLGLLSTCP